MWRANVLRGSCGALAIVLAFWAGEARAGEDTMRLGGSEVDAATLKLGFDGNAETQLAHYYGGRGFGGYGYGRGFGFGFGYGGYGRGYGYRSYYGGYGYRPYYGFYRPYYYYRPYYSGYYGYPAYYSYPSYYYSAPVYYGSYYYGCADNAVHQPAVTLGQSTTITQVPVGTPLGSVSASSPVVNSGSGTYLYNGGPARQTPQPGVAPNPLPPNPAPLAEPRPNTIPREGRLVSLPVAPDLVNVRVNYPAYGQK